MPDIHQALAAIAAARRDDPLAPVTVVVPSHLAALQLRRRLATMGPFAAVRFETLPRIAELLAAGHLAAAGRHPLARPIADYTAQQVAAESRAGLEDVGELPGYARVLRQMFRRLRRGGIRRAAEAGDHPGGHMREVLRLYDLFREATAAFYDEEDLLEAAAAAISSGRAGALPDLGAVYAVPPGAQSAGGVALLSALRDAAPAYAALDEPAVAAEMRFVLAPDPASEAREAVRDTLRALESGIAIDETAAFYGADPAYRRLLREAFASAGVPASPFPGVPLIETPAGRGLFLLASLPGRDFSRTAVMDFLSVAPLREWLPGALGNVRALTSVWDRLSRAAGITRRADRWSTALDALVADRNAELATPRVQENEARGRALEFERDQAAALQGVIERLIARLAPLSARQPASAFIPAFKRLVADYFDPKAEALAEATEEIDQLGTVAAVGGSFGLDSFAQALRANLEAASIRERGLGAGVTLTDYRAAAGLQFGHVVLCGAYEGAFPAGPGGDVLVADSDWSRMRDGHPYVEDAALRSERAMAAARRALAAAGGGTLVWSSPLYEPGGSRQYYPSPMMVAAAGERLPDVGTASELRGVRSGAAVRRGASPLAVMVSGPTIDRAELLIRRAVVQSRDRIPVDEGHPRRRALAMLNARRSNRFSEWDGNLAELAGQDWLSRSRTASPTSLEHYAVCGFRYLCRSLLRLNTVEEPEERELMDPAARGSLLHRLLDAFFREQQARDRPAPGEAWSDHDAARLLEMMQAQLEAARRRGQTGLDVYAAHEERMMRADLATFLEEDTAFRRRTGARPAEFESAVPEVEIAGVVLRGYVDRVDRSPDGRRAWVIDYKTGSARGFAISEDDPFAGGAKLQLPTYVAAAGDAAEVHALYWFVTHRGGFEFVEYEPTPERQARFQQTVRSILDGARSGAFPAVPGEENDRYGGFDNCRYCEFDRICSRRRDYDFARKADDPALTAWARVQAAARGEDNG